MKVLENTGNGQIVCLDPEEDDLEGPHWLTEVGAKRPFSQMPRGKIHALITTEGIYRVVHNAVVCNCQEG